MLDLRQKPMSDGEFIRFLNSDTSRTVSIISCGRQKLNKAAPARSLYTSYIFQSSLRVASRISDLVRIVSAKYGILDPDQVVEPYDKHLGKLAEGELASWRASIAHFSEYVSELRSEVILFAGARYADEFENIMAREVHVRRALGQLSMGYRTSLLKRFNYILDREYYAGQLYNFVSSRIEKGSIFRFSELKTSILPPRGVYIFFDPSETTRFSQVVPRIVRIGTHAVSEGSNSTLRSRLRAHFGVGSGEGSHRSSVFRLHVGAAMLNQRGQENSFASWGIGQSTDREVRHAEAPLEREVSSYMRNLLVLPIEIHDAASSRSRRAFIERALICMLAGEGGPLEPSSSAWLGNFSSNQKVCASGLWNVQHVASRSSKRDMATAMKLLTHPPGALL